MERRDPAQRIRLRHVTSGLGARGYAGAMTDTVAPAPTQPVTDPIRGPVVLWLLATGLVAGAAALLFHDLTRSNRPHELVNTPWVVVLNLVTLWPCVAAAVGLRRAWHAPPGGPATWQRRVGLITLSVLLLLITLADLAMLVFGLQALPAVLGAA